MHSRVLGLVLPLVLGTCSSGGYEAHDGAVLHTDLAADSGGAADLADRKDTGSSCITAFSCDARTAEHGCGVTTTTGQRYPNLGAPYCTGDKTTRQGCSCDLVRCVSPAPLCPGTYQAAFSERLLSGCSGIPNMQSGTCAALWNTVQSSPGAVVLSDRSLLNVDLDWDFVPYQQAFRVMVPTVVKLTVQQDCWFADVSGVGNAGRGEVGMITVLAQ